MRLTIIRDDGVVGIDGVFKKIDMSGLAAGIRAVQWDGEGGHIEYDDMTNEIMTGISEFQPFIDAWNIPKPLPIVAAPDLIAAAHERINNDYSIAVNAIVGQYPQEERDSWPVQEAEAQAWTANNAAPTPWIDAASTERGITKAALAALILANASSFKATSGQLSGKRQRLRDQIDALGASPTQAQLDAIQW